MKGLVHLSSTEQERFSQRLDQLALGECVALQGNKIFYLAPLRKGEWELLLQALEPENAQRAFEVVYQLQADEVRSLHLEELTRWVEGVVLRNEWHPRLYFTVEGERTTDLYDFSTATADQSFHLSCQRAASQIVRLYEWNAELHDPLALESVLLLVSYFKAYGGAPHLLQLLRNGRARDISLRGIPAWQIAGRVLADVVGNTPEPSTIELSGLIDTPELAAAVFVGMANNRAEGYQDLLPKALEQTLKSTTPAPRSVCLAYLSNPIGNGFAWLVNGVRSLLAHWTGPRAFEVFVRCNESPQNHGSIEYHPPVDGFGMTKEAHYIVVRPARAGSDSPIGIEVMDDLVEDLMGSIVPYLQPASETLDETVAALEREKPLVLEPCRA